MYRGYLVGLGPQNAQVNRGESKGLHNPQTGTAVFQRWRELCTLRYLVSDLTSCWFINSWRFGKRGKGGKLSFCRWLMLFILTYCSRLPSSNISIRTNFRWSLFEQNKDVWKTAGDTLASSNIKMDLKVSLWEVKFNGWLRHDQTAHMFRAGMGHQTVTPATNLLYCFLW